MTGTAKSYSADKIVLGPSDVWLNVAVPSASARLTVAADLTPDASANPSAVHLGMTESGITFEYKPETQDFHSDELEFAHLSRLLSGTATIKGNWLQVFDWSLLGTMTVGGTKTINTSTTSGFHSLTGGGLSSISTYSIAVIGPDIAAPTLYWVIQFYKCYNKAGLSLGVTRKDQAKSPFEFFAQGVTTRAAGDQSFNYWKSLVVGA